MSMNSNGPGSTRRARTSRAAGSRVRSDTQLQVRPASSGCMVSRNRKYVSVDSRISTEAYSVNRSGQVARSLVIAQTWSTSASMTIELSVWPTVCVCGLSVLVTSESSRWAYAGWEEAARTASTISPNEDQHQEIGRAHV